MSSVLIFHSVHRIRYVEVMFLHYLEFWVILDLIPTITQISTLRIAYNPPVMHCDEQHKIVRTNSRLLITSKNVQLLFCLAPQRQISSVSTDVPVVKKKWIHRSSSCKLILLLSFLLFSNQLGIIVKVILPIHSRKWVFHLWRSHRLNLHLLHKINSQTEIRKK